MAEAALLDAPAGARIRPTAPFPHTKTLGTIQVLVEMGKNTVAAFGAPAYEERYIHSANWLKEFLLISDPEGIKHVLLDNAANYEKAEQFRRILGPAIGNGLVTADGASWRFQRRVAAPMFQMRHIETATPAMSAAVADMLSRWDARPQGNVIDVASEMPRLTYDIISRTMFSNDVTMRFDEMSMAFERYLETLGKVDPLTVIMPRWFPTPGKLRARGPLRFLRREIEALIARRRALIEDDPANVPSDLLTLLLTTKDPEGGALFGDAEVFDNVMTFIFAGHETTANALSWTFYLLATFPEWEARVAEEATSVLSGDARASDISRLPVARMVLEEAMRLYPPAPIITRDSIGPDVVGGNAIGAGAAVMISPWVLHRHRTLWDDPDYFDPERFAPGNREKIHRFAYLPFGGGQRICIGMGFAMQEAIVALSMIASRYRLTLAPGHPVEALSRITLRPMNGLKMVLTRR